jgi:hypothetical protein
LLQISLSEGLNVEVKRWLDPSHPAGIVSSSTSAQPQEQYTRGLACTGTICGLLGAAAISCTSLLRVASLNCSRSLIVMTNDPGPPMTQSS